MQRDGAPVSALQLVREEAELYDEADPNFKFLRSNYREIQRQYPDEYVAIHRAQVMAHGKKLDDVIKAIRAAKVDSSRVIVEFVPDEKSALVV